MKILNKVSELHKSTKITIAACAAFLVLTGIVLIVLMAFPIEPKQQTKVEYLPAADVESDDSSIPDENAWQNTEAPHTLSTWKVSIDTHTRSGNEYFEYLRSTTITQESETSDSLTSETLTMGESTTADEWQETGAGQFEETGTSGFETDEYVHSETQTETVVIPTEAEGLNTQAPSGIL